MGVGSRSRGREAGRARVPNYQLTESEPCGAVGESGWGRPIFLRCRLAYGQVDQERLRSAADWAVLGSGKGSDVRSTLSVHRLATSCLYGGWMLVCVRSTSSRP